MATEIDLGWTYVGGPAKAVQAVLSDPRIGALPVGPQDALTHVEGWVEEWAAGIVEKLLTTGDATFEVPGASLSARLQRPTRFRGGSLTINTSSSDGQLGGGLVWAPTRDLGDNLKDHITFYVTQSLTGLVE